MRKIALISLLAFLVACADEAPVAPDQQHVGNVMAAKGGNKPPEAPSSADPAIAFFTYSREYEYSIRVMNEDGSNNTRLIWGDGVIDPSWKPGTPGEGSMAYTKRRGTESGYYELWRMDVRVDGGVLVAESSGPLAECAGEPAWSPVGVGWASGKEVIAYVEQGYNCAPGAHSNPTSYELRYVCAEGDGTCGGTLHTALEGVRINYAAWSPDASGIAFVESGRIGDENVWWIKILDLGTSPPTVSEVFTTEGTGLHEVWYLDWSRVGDRLAFSAHGMTAGGEKGKGKPKVRSYVYTLDVTPNGEGGWTPGTLTQLIEGSGVTWWPDDQYLVVSQAWDLLKVDAATGTIVATLSDCGAAPDMKRPCGLRRMKAPEPAALGQSHLPSLNTGR
ncbi:MAG: hypothetical protein AMS25_16990 [Gemmatimonas sp. SM23_52]|nr:MAG: hypothetical protein AMS25_16990 [Gemmatimonas sp. SM23_52]